MGEKDIKAPGDTLFTVLKRELIAKGIDPTSPEGQRALRHIQRADKVIRRYPRPASQKAVHTCRQKPQPTRRPLILGLLYAYREPLQAGTQTFNDFHTKLRNILKTREAMHVTEKGAFPFDRPLEKTRAVTWTMIESLLTSDERKWHAEHGQPAKDQQPTDRAVGGSVLVGAMGRGSAPANRRPSF